MSEWTDIDADEETFARDLAAGLGHLRARGSQCPRPDLLVAHREGVLPAEIGDDVGAHLARCALCRALQQDLAEAAPGPTAEETRRIAVAVLPRYPTTTEGAQRRSWTWLWRPVPALAALAVVFCVGAWWMTRGVPGGGSPASLPAPRALAPAVSDRFDLPLTKAAIRVPLSAALTWRGESTQSRGYADGLARALAAYRDDDIPDASRRLESLARSHPTRDACFYLGVCRLLLGSPAEAAIALEKARTEAGRAPDPEIDWYLALAHDRVGRQAEARAALQRVCAARSERQAAACDALARLAPRR